MARARRLRSYSRDCFAPSQETTGEHHAYDLVYLQNVDLGKFSMRAMSISPSLRALALQLNASHSLRQVSNQTQQRETTTTMPHEEHYNDVTRISRHYWNNKVSLTFLALQPTSSNHEALLSRQTQGKTSLSLSMSHANESQFCSTCTNAELSIGQRQRQKKGKQPEPRVATGQQSFKSSRVDNHKLWQNKALQQFGAVHTYAVKQSKPSIRIQPRKVKCDYRTHLKSHISKKH